MQAKYIDNYMMAWHEVLTTQGLKNEHFQASFALVTSHIAQHWFSGCSREAQNLKLLPSSQRTTMLQLLSKLLIRGSERVQVIPSQIQPLWGCKRVFKITSMRTCTPPFPRDKLTCIHNQLNETVSRSTKALFFIAKSTVMFMMYKIN